MYEGEVGEGVGEGVFRTRTGESELFGKLKVGRASLGEEKEGLEGWQQILSMLPACAESEGSPAGLRGQSDDNFGTHCCWLLLLAD